MTESETPPEATPNEATGHEAATREAASTETAAEQEEMHFPEPQPVAVEIYDQIYRLRGTDPEYLHGLAATVDSKMRAVSAHGTTVDSLRVAVLASLNIADELLRLQQRYDELAGSLNVKEQGLRSRADSLGELLDEVLDVRKEE